MQVHKRKQKQYGSFRNDFTPLCYPKYTPDTSCRTVAARTYVKENAENYQKMPKKKKKEIRLDKSRFDWDTNAPPWEERKKIHPVKRPKIPDFCTSHHHNLDLIETFLFSWVTTNNNNAKKWKRKIMCVSIYFRLVLSALTISMLSMRNTTKASKICWVEDFLNCG